MVFAFTHNQVKTFLLAEFFLHLLCCSTVGVDVFLVSSSLGGATIQLQFGGVAVFWIHHARLLVHAWPDATKHFLVLSTLVVSYLPDTVVYLPCVVAQL